MIIELWQHQEPLTNTCRYMYSYNVLLLTYQCSKRPFLQVSEYTAYSARVRVGAKEERCCVLPQTGEYKPTNRTHPCPHDR